MLGVGDTLYCISQSPLAAVTNYHRLSGLKGHTFIILQFLRSEIQHRSCGTKINMSAELSSCLEALGHNPLPCSFQVSGGHPYSLDGGLIPPTSKPGPSPSHTAISLVLSCAALFHLYNGPTWIIQNHLSISKSAD